MSARRLTPSITISFLGAYLPRLAFLVTFLTGLLPNSITVRSLWSTCLLGLHVFLSRLACPRNLCWALFSNYIIYTVVDRVTPDVSRYLGLGSRPPRNWSLHVT